MSADIGLMLLVTCDSEEVVAENNVVICGWIARPVGATPPLGSAQTGVEFVGGGLTLQFGSPVSSRIHGRLLRTGRGRPSISIIHHTHLSVSLSPISSLISIDVIVVLLSTLLFNTCC